MNISIPESKRVMDMTAKDLREIIRDVVYELTDPDYGLTLTTETEGKLKDSLESKERVSVEKVAERLGFNW
ncbi:hypothetical protein [Candidatus Magnetomonas plexicatena]|uniref:hypothetical protein n=1 Tax=Candidatus Magnetomonas plexicatena TaxID=2552947 RepID=UPI001103252C|nr:hypothetical protein E2O03_013130 [Nitrospirales bacterium LBB_01]